MGIGDVGAAMIELLPNLCVPAKRGLGRMTTEIMECWSLEEGDQILVNGEVYKIVDIIPDFSKRFEYILTVVDEEGFRHEIGADGAKKFRLIVDTLSEV